MKKIKGITKYPLLLVIAVMIVVTFISYVIKPQQDKSEWENRYLEKRPAFVLKDLADGSFMTSFENYANDQIIFRDVLIKSKAFMEMLLLKSTNNGIAKGADGYLFAEDTSDGSVFKRNVKIIKEFAENSDREITIMLAPNACGVLTDKVPMGMPVANQEKMIDEFQIEISLLKNVRVVDLLMVLKAHKDEYIYYRTDHHWTTYGGYLAYCQFSDSPVELEFLSENEVNNFYGTLYAKYKGINVIPDTIEYYDLPIKKAEFGKENVDTLYDLSKTEVFDKYGMFIYGNNGFSKIESNSNNARKIIVFKDSYANCVIPFLTADYSEIDIIDLRYFGESVQDFLESNTDSDILFLYNYDFLNEDNHFYKLMK